MSDFQSSIKVVQLAAVGGGAETWVRTLDSPNVGDVTFNGSLGSVLIVPASTINSGNSGNTLVAADNNSPNYFILHSQANPLEDGTYIKYTDGVNYWYVQV